MCIILDLMITVIVSVRNNLVGRIFFTNYTASLFASSVIQNTYKFRAGATYEYFRFKSKLAGDLPDSLSNFNSYANLFLSFNSDSRDRPYLSSKGKKSELKAEYVLPLSKDWVDQFFSNSLVFWFNYKQWIPVSKKITFIPGIFLGATYSKNYPYSADNIRALIMFRLHNTGFIWEARQKATIFQLFSPLQVLILWNAMAFTRRLLSTSVQYNFYQ